MLLISLVVMVSGEPRRASALFAGALPVRFMALTTDILLLASNSELSARCTASVFTAARAAPAEAIPKEASAAQRKRFIGFSRQKPSVIVLDATEPRRAQNALMPV